MQSFMNAPAAAAAHAARSASAAASTAAQAASSAAQAAAAAAAPPTPCESPAAPVPAAAAPAVPEAPLGEAEIAEKIVFLQSMGFVDEEKDRALLMRHHGDLNTCIEELGREDKPVAPQ